MKFNSTELAWEKMQGLLPAIIQDAKTNKILMLGYMNQDALQKTITTEWVTFYSRTKNQLWTKGETSGNKLKLIAIAADCDNDTLLIKAEPMGPTCHTGAVSCFAQTPENNLNFITDLESIIAERQQLRPANSYVAKLFNEGLSRITQKLGEESIEVVLAAIEKNDQEFCGEVADLFFHLLVLLKARNLQFVDIINVLKNRNYQSIK